jgi:hypothetical protein
MAAGLVLVVVVRVLLVKVVVVAGLRVCFSNTLDFILHD